MHDDPLRAQSLALVAGCVAATVAVAACAILAYARPQGTLGSASIAMARETGALYVRVDDTWYPVPNLVSARLISRSAANPVTVQEASVAAAKRGPAMGIPGAPATIGVPLAPSSWTVCDADRTTVIVDGVDGERLDGSRSVLVAPRGEAQATTYLLYEGRRAEVDLRNPAVVRALRLEAVAPKPVSRTLLDAVPEVPAIAAPAIPGAGASGAAALPGFAVGSVVRVVRAESIDYYAVLRDGVQRIGEVAADLIRFAYPAGPDAVADVPPAAIAGVRVVDELAVDHLPRRAREPLGGDRSPAVCVRWRPEGPDGRAGSEVLTGPPPPHAERAVRLAQADGDGPHVDAVYVPPGRAADVRAAAVAGGESAGGPRYLVTDLGVLYGLHDDDVAGHLGMTGDPVAAPWPVLAALPRGPELSVEAASVLRDGLSAPS